MSQNTSRGWRNKKDSSNITISPILKKITDSNSKENLESNINEILLSLQDQYQSSSESDMKRSKLISSFKKNDEKFTSKKVQFNNFSEHLKNTDETNNQNNILFFSLKRKKEKNGGYSDNKHSYNSKDDDFEIAVDLTQLKPDKYEKQTLNAAPNEPRAQKSHSIISRSKSDQTHVKQKSRKQNEILNNKNQAKESITKKDISKNEANENQAKSHQRQNKITRSKTDEPKAKITNISKSDDIDLPKKSIKRTRLDKSQTKKPEVQDTKENPEENQAVKPRKKHSIIRRSVTDNKSKADTDNVEEKIENIYKKDDTKPKKKVKRTKSDKSKTNEPEIQEIKEKQDENQAVKPRKKHPVIRRSVTDNKSKTDTDNVEEKIENIYKKDDVKPKKAPKKKKPTRISSSSKESVMEQLNELNKTILKSHDDKIKKEQNKNEEKKEEQITQKPSRHSNKEKQAEDSKNGFIDYSSGVEVNVTYSEEMKPEPTTFDVKFKLDQKPFCIAVGDIDGIYEKFERITKFIDENTDLDFLFIGDLIDDLSDSSPEKQRSWQIVTELANKYINDEYEFKRDSEKRPNSYDDDNVIYLPSGFKDIHFKRINYKNLKNNRVKFIAGNKECNSLIDFQHFIEMKDNEYVFGEGQYKKTATFEQLCNLYKYFNRCYGIIFDQKEDKGSNYIHKIIFKHHIMMFDPNRYSSKLLNQNIPISENEYNNGNYIIICGHSKIFSSSLSSKNRNVFLIDSNSGSADAKKPICPKEGLGLGLYDNRIAIVNFDDNNNGFSVMPFIYPGLNDFYKWEFDYSFQQMTKYNPSKSPERKRSPNKNRNIKS